MHRGYGGFPMPLTLIGRLVNNLFPGVKHKLRRKMTQGVKRASEIDCTCGSTVGLHQERTR